MSSTATWPIRILRFFALYLKDLVTSNVVLARDILTPGTATAAGIVRLPLRCRTPLEVTVFANLVSITPGTLTLSVQQDPPVLHVHGMYAPDREAFRSELYEREGRLLSAMRRNGDPGPVPQPDEAGGSAGGTS